MQQSLAPMGYRIRRPNRVPLLTERHPDKSQFQLFRAYCRFQVWCKPNKTMNPSRQLWLLAVFIQYRLGLLVRISALLTVYTAF